MQRYKPQLNRLYMHQPVNSRGMKLKHFDNFEYIDGEIVKVGSVNRYVMDVDEKVAFTLITKSTDIDNIEHFFTTSAAGLTREQYASVVGRPITTDYLYSGD